MNPLLNAAIILASLCPGSLVMFMVYAMVFVRVSEEATETPKSH